MNLSNIESFVTNISSTVRLHIVKLKIGNSLVYFTDNRDRNISVPQGVFIYEDICCFCYKQSLSVIDTDFFYLYKGCKYQIEYNDMMILEVMA
jgi:hypothetical protein